MPHLVRERLFFGDINDAIAALTTTTADSRRLHPPPLRRQLRLHLLHHRLPPGPLHPHRGGPPRGRRGGGRAAGLRRGPPGG
ncbi:hypothetical protein EE612_057622 [Oryza sativa]|nr:hypothetical protein EE612_057622 [Oryza sativa]